MLEELIAYLLGLLGIEEGSEPSGEYAGFPEPDG